MRRPLFLPAALSLLLLSPATRAEEQPKGIPASASVPAPVTVPTDVKGDEHQHVVRVNVTTQNWDFLRPWGKRPPVTRRAIGAVLPGGGVLVSAELVGNANYIEFEVPEGGRKTPATIEAVDYECNLALLKGEDEKFIEAFRPFELIEGKVGDNMQVWQLENTGVVLATTGPLTTVEVSRYPIDESALLVYRLTASIQFRDSSFVLPVIKAGKLAGLVVRYDNSSNSAEIVPTPVIQHFLKDAANAPYEGFPRTGMAFADTRDPQLRRYVGINGNGGVYITNVLPGSPAAVAGIKEGDIILSIDGKSIDQDGNYIDPTYGKLALIHLISTKHYAGDTVKFAVQREGKKVDIEVKVERRDPKSFVVEPYIIDRAPNFYILGGLVLQELSRQYLKDFGNDWQKRAPEELVYFDRYQDDLFEKGPKKLVILTRVLPLPSTLGYEELSHLRVTKINGMELQSLDDVPKSLEKVVDGVHRIEFDGDPSVIFLDATTLSSDEKALIQNYRLPTTKRFGS